MDHSMRTAFQFFQTEARAFQEGFDEFVAWNARTPGSPLAGQDARAVFHAVWDRAERGELKWPGTDRPFTTLDLQGVMFGPQYGPDWPGMAEILQFLLTMPASDGFTAGEVHDPFQAVFCLDWRLPIHNYYELDAYRRISAATVARDVRFSPLGLAASTACQGWPIRTTNPQHDLRWRGAPPILMLNSRFDPATPYEWAATAARQSGAVLLSYDGWGHGAYFKNSDCVVSAVDNYLINRQVPPRGKHCAAVEPGLRQLTGTTSRIAGPWGF
jgi:hypothetical protein